MEDLDQPSKRYLTAYRQRDGKHEACLIEKDTGTLIYVSEPKDTLDDALDDIYAELTLRHAAMGEIIDIKRIRKSNDPE